MIPIRMEGEVAVFTTDQVDDYGLPELYGFTRYYVVQSQPHYQFTWTEQSQGYIKRIHRYSRDERFLATLRNLLGFSNRTIEPHVLTIIKTYFKPGNDPYEACRKIIKHYKWGKMHALIPTILRRIGAKPPIVISKDFQKVFNKIISDYKAIQTVFKSVHAGKYFPNMKYVAIKLLQKNGVEVNMPAMRTKRKLKCADVKFDLMMEKAFQE